MFFKQGLKLNMKGSNELNCFISYFSDGTPVPDVLTEQEAIKFLRLDELENKNPATTLAYYRSEGLRGTKVGKKVRYLKSELLNFLNLKTQMAAGEIS